MTDTAIRLEGVSRSFGPTLALSDISLDVPRDSITGLLGRNGAGKTTLMSLIAGHDRPGSGTVRVFGENPFENAAVDSRLSFLRDNQRYPDDLTLTHALRIAPRFHAAWSAELAAELVAAFRLPARIDVRKFSRGQLSSLGIVLGLASRAEVTIFDEPYLGLDATARRIFYDALLRDYAAHPRAMLISTHLIDEMEAIFESVIVVEAGRVVLAAGVEEALASAYTVSGPAAVVLAQVEGRKILHTHRVGGLAAVTIAGRLLPAEAAAARERGLETAAASLQELVAAFGSVDTTTDSEARS